MICLNILKQNEQNEMKQNEIECHKDSILLFKIL